VPVYEYACTDCGERLEVRQSFTDDPLTDCPACSGRLRKVLSPVGVVFKGSGFYRTDSRAADNGSSSSGSGGSGEKGEKGDKKPAEKAPAKEAASVGSSANGSSGSGASTSSSSDTSSSSTAKPKAATGS
jgi:putative FmdB family regulatory protein